MKIKEELEKILNELVDWEHVHRDMVLGQYGQNLEIYADGTHEVLSHGTYTHCAVAAMKTIGSGNIENSYYLEGWGHYDSETGIFIADDGRELSFEEAVEESVAEGHHCELYEQWKEEILASV